MCGASWWCGGDSGEGGMRASSGDAQTLVSCVALVLAHVECGRWGLGGMWSVRESRDSHAARWMVCDSVQRGAQPRIQRSSPPVGDQ